MSNNDASAINYRMHDHQHMDWHRSTRLLGVTSYPIRFFLSPILPVKKCQVLNLIASSWVMILTSHISVLYHYKHYHSHMGVRLSPTRQTSPPSITRTIVPGTPKQYLQSQCCDFANRHQRSIREFFTQRLHRWTRQSSSCCPTTCRTLQQSRAHPVQELPSRPLRHYI